MISNMFEAVKPVKNTALDCSGINFGVIGIRWFLEWGSEYATAEVQ